MSHRSGETIYGGRNWIDLAWHAAAAVSLLTSTPPLTYLALIHLTMLLYFYRT